MANLYHKQKNTWIPVTLGAVWRWYVKRTWLLPFKGYLLSAQVSTNILNKYNNINNNSFAHGSMCIEHDI